MALRTDLKDRDDWQSLDTLHSGRKTACPNGNSPGKDCWKRALREDNVCFFSVCLDCFVYLYQQKKATLSRNEIQDILKARKNITQENYSLPPSSNKSMKMASEQL